MAVFHERHGHLNSELSCSVVKFAIICRNHTDVWISVFIYRIGSHQAVEHTFKNGAVSLNSLHWSCRIPV